MKILAIGDTHCNTSAICNVAIPQARKNDCEYIVQCGDFGYLEHEDDGRRFLHKVSKHLVRNNLIMYWIDGNHDNHPKLWAEYPPGDDGLCLIRPNLFYVPRGTVFKLGHVTCLGLGGAFSIDREWRLEQEKKSGKPLTWYWPTEMITSGDCATACENAERYGPIDIMFTHEAPTGLDIPGHHADDKWRWPLSNINRDFLREVFDEVQPKLLIHGHHHRRYTWKLPLKPNQAKLDGGLLEWDYCRVDGLANDGRTGFAICLDLDAMFVAELEK